MFPVAEIGELYEKKRQCFSEFKAQEREYLQSRDIYRRRLREEQQRKKEEEKQQQYENHLKEL